nr:MAG TPA: hypothetical protein [Caudoviricetes sp.]
MLYIALALTTMLTIFYGIAYNEQKHQTYTFKCKVNMLACNNKILQEKLDKVKRKEEMDKRPIYSRL